MDDVVFMQIGTNNGDDYFNEVVKKCYPDKVILVEPNASLNAEILQNYSGVSNVFIENVAITGVPQKEAKLCIRRSWNQPGHLNGIRYDGGFSMLPLDDWGDDLDYITSPCMTFNALCKKHNVYDINYLMIDTEGYDAEIIRHIDFDLINIDYIQYEWWGFPVSMFSRHKDKDVLFGDAGMAYVAKLLISKGYVIRHEKENVIAIKQ
jgi:FkbM family methyltransferase